ncbi:MAG TPA: hypothetical protein DDW17_01075 [Deltaproteobacteria bacterium]|nr:hypothetical protein [Deltaproteobacteria bacterium]
MTEFDKFYYDSKNDLYFEQGFQPVDYSDGSEDYLIEIFNNIDYSHSSPQELQKYIKDWPTRYHLSHLRTNLLEAMKDIFKKEWSVLELGAGTGVITSWLCKYFSNVCAIEGVIKRAKSLRLRTKNIQNLQVVVGNVSSIVPPQCYNLITLIGVLEYIPYYINGVEPGIAATNFLKRLKEYLADDGFIFIAIENKFGAKYFSGCTEDHNKKLFSGIMGYPERSPITFSKNELQSILQDAGFKRIKFYHLFPDYKMMKTICKDDPNLYRYVSGWIRGMFENYEHGREYYFHDALFIENLIKGNILEHFSNSFLVLCAKSDKVNLESPWLIKKFWNHEHTKDSFHHTIALFFENDKTFILREPLSGGQRDVNMENVEFHLTEKEDFMHGSPVIVEAYKSIFINDSYKSLVNILKEIMGDVISLYFLGQHDEEGYQLIDGKAVDYCFWNLIRNKSGTMVFIDRKWSFKKDITIDYIIFRNLYHLYNDIYPFVSEKTLSDFVFNIMQKLFTQYSSERHARNFAIESVFQNDITTLHYNLAYTSAQYNIKSNFTYIRELESKIQQKELALQNIYSSTGWRMLLKYYRIRDSIFPEGTARKSLMNSVIRLFRLLTELNIKKSISYLKTYGMRAFLRKLREKIAEGNLYDIWIAKNEPDNTELAYQKEKTFPVSPKISIVVPVYNTPKQFLIDMIESVINQTYPNWELCLADGMSKEPYVHEILNGYSKQDDRVKIKFLQNNKGIAGNSNEALSLATGDFVGFLDHDDLLPPFALYEIVKAINENPGVDFIYSDEDKVLEDGRVRFDPRFKPDWSPDTLRSHNYIAHFTVIRSDLLQKIGCFREGYDGSQDYDLILRAIEKADRILHIPKVLYHWRASGASAAGDPEAKPYAYEAAKKALKDHLDRNGIKGVISDGIFLGSYKVTYEIKDSPKVSILIPNKDHADDLSRCISSISSRSTYKNYEIIVIENGSNEKKTFQLYEKLKKMDQINVVNWNKKFNYSAVNNFGAQYAKGEILLFLNNDVEVINSDWMENLLQHAMRKEVGAVGAKLYYPDDKIQHAGIVIGMGGIAEHPHKYFHRKSQGYMKRLLFIQNVSAVTGACLMVRKEVFQEIGGFDEEFPLAFNDVDLCLRIRDKGYLVIFTPYVELYHHESKTRGYDDTLEKKLRFQREIDLFKIKWNKLLIEGDPYYNKNLTLNKTDSSIRI